MAPETQRGSDTREGLKAIEGEAVPARLADIRKRMEQAVRHDRDALSVLNRIFPKEWDEFEPMYATVWILGNAAEFGNGMAQEWLARLVNEGGEPL